MEIELRFFNERREQVWHGTAATEFEVGRQERDESQGPISLGLHPVHGNRLVVASATVLHVPRHWFRVSVTDDGDIQIRNVHAQHAVPYEGSSVPPSTSVVIGPEVNVNLGCGYLCIKNKLPVVVEEPGRGTVLISQGVSLPSLTLRHMLTTGRSESETRGVVELLEHALEVVREAAGSNAFVSRATQAVANIVGLDRAVMLRRAEDGRWEAEHTSLREPVMSPPPISQRLLNRVELGLRTETFGNSPADAQGGSLMQVQCAVAAPVINRAGNLIRILYGDRWVQRPEFPDNAIAPVEQKLVEVIASAVAAGILRQEEERQRLQLGEFFSPRVAQLLTQHEELLKGRDAEVTVLFCDIRGFSSVSERMGPVQTLEWLYDVLSELSQCVVERDGVLVDYVGDQLMAMFGAPEQQPDHALRGVQAAVAMMERIELLRRRWDGRLPLFFDVGIGLNSGQARVGNIGSRHKFKYGVLGNTVNFCSRLQDATKQFEVQCLIAESTVIGARAQSRARRLAKLSVVGIDTPANVYELVRAPDAGWESLKTNYESALHAFESQQFADSTLKLGQVLNSHRQDRPSQLLLQRAVTELVKPSDPFHPVWKLTQK